MTVYTDDEIRYHREITLGAMLELGPDKFDMSTWATSDEYPGGAVLDDVRRIDLTSCGTSGCMGGTAVFAAERAGIPIADLDEEGDLAVADWLGINYMDFYKWMTEPRTVQHHNACGFFADLLGVVP